MAKAISLARKGEGFTSPNPMVGAVLVKDGIIIGQDYHKKAGLAHAESLAIAKAGSAAKGATLYVNLEPCNHFGKTPPCTEAIISAGIRRVVAAMRDPNPQVKGGGIERLNAAGIETEVGVLQEKAAELNEQYLYNKTTGLPFVIIKVAATLDGKIATRTGDSKWISSPKAREFAHHLRHSVDAVAIGSGTVQKDNPQLTVRLENNQYFSHRVIFDSSLRISPDARIYREKDHGKLYVVTSEKTDDAKAILLESIGVTIIRVGNDKNGFPDIKESLRKLGGEGITSILVEGGAKFISSFIKSGMANKLVAVYAPMIIGGREAVPMIDDLGIESISNAITLKKNSWRKFGEEIIFTGYFK